MQFTPKELRFLATLARKEIAEGRRRLQTMNEDTDEYMELANDLMVLDVLLSKWRQGIHEVFRRL